MYISGPISIWYDKILGQDFLLTNLNNFCLRCIKFNKQIIFLQIEQSALDSKFYRRKNGALVINDIVPLLFSSRVGKHTTSKTYLNCLYKEIKINSQEEQNKSRIASLLTRSIVCVFLCLFYRRITKMDKFTGSKVSFMLNYPELGRLDSLDIYTDKTRDSKHFT